MLIVILWLVLRASYILFTLHIHPLPPPLPLLRHLSHLRTITFSLLCPFHHSISHPPRSPTPYLFPCHISLLLGIDKSEFSEVKMDIGVSGGWRGYYRLKRRRKRRTEDRELPNWTWKGRGRGRRGRNQTRSGMGCRTGSTFPHQYRQHHRQHRR